MSLEKAILHKTGAVLLKTAAVFAERSKTGLECHNNLLKARLTIKMYQFVYIYAIQRLRNTQQSSNRHPSACKHLQSRCLQREL